MLSVDIWLELQAVSCLIAIMRIVTWNCQCAYRNKAAHIVNYAPDIAVIQECESPERLARNRTGPQRVDPVWFGHIPFKGLAIFSYTGLKFGLYEGYDPSLQYCVPLRVHGTGRADFNLIAVWAQAHSNRRLSYIGQVYQAVEHYADFMDEADTLVIGDFNSNKIWDHLPRVGNHSDVVERLAAHGLVSVYHEHYREAQGAETRPTYFQYRHKSIPFHLDYCFVPAGWARRLTSLTVGSYDDWSGLSDHCPIFVEFDLV